MTAGLPATAVALLAQFWVAAACAQQYPVKPVRIVASEAGRNGQPRPRKRSEGGFTRLIPFATL